MVLLCTEEHPKSSAWLSAGSLPHPGTYPELLMAWNIMLAYCARPGLVAPCGVSKIVVYLLLPSVTLGPLMLKKLSCDHGEHLLRRKHLARDATGTRRPLLPEC